MDHGNPLDGRGRNINENNRIDQPRSSLKGRIANIHVLCDFNEWLYFRLDFGKSVIVFSITSQKSMQVEKKKALFFSAFLIEINLQNEVISDQSHPDRKLVGSHP